MVRKHQNAPYTYLFTQEYHIFMFLARHIVEHRRLPPIMLNLNGHTMAGQMKRKNMKPPIEAGRTSAEGNRLFCCKDKRDHGDEICRHSLRNPTNCMTYLGCFTKVATNQTYIKRDLVERGKNTIKNVLAQTLQITVRAVKK